MAMGTAPAPGLEAYEAQEHYTLYTNKQSAAEGSGHYATCMGKQSGARRAVADGYGAGARRFLGTPSWQRPHPADRTSAAPAEMSSATTGVGDAGAASAFVAIPSGGGIDRSRGGIGRGGGDGRYRGGAAFHPSGVRPLQTLDPLNSFHSPHSPSIFTAAKLSGGVMTAACTGTLAARVGVRAPAASASGAGEVTGTGTAGGRLSPVFLAADAAHQAEAAHSRPAAMKRGSGPGCQGVRPDSLVTMGLGAGWRVSAANFGGDGGGAGARSEHGLRGDGAAACAFGVHFGTPASHFPCPAVETKHSPGDPWGVVEPEDLKDMGEGGDDDDAAADDDDDLMEPDDMMVRVDDRAEELRETARSLSGWAAAEDSHCRLRSDRDHAVPLAVRTSAAIDCDHSHPQL